MTLHIVHTRDGRETNILSGPIYWYKAHETGMLEYFNHEDQWVILTPTQWSQCTVVHHEHEFTFENLST